LWNKRGIFMAIRYANVKIDGKLLEFGPNEQRPRRIPVMPALIPVRAVFEAMGYTVSWNASQRMVTLTNPAYRVRFKLDSAAFTTNGIEGHFSGTPRNPMRAAAIGGSAMVPYPEILKSVGCMAEWEDNLGDDRDVIAGTVVIWTPTDESGYFATSRLMIRDAPNGNSVSAFIRGRRVEAVLPLETRQVPGSEHTWVKVYYDGNEAGWVAKEFLEEFPRPLAGYNFKYNWDKSEFVTPKFKHKVAGISKRLEIDPDDLMAVMAFESFFNPAQRNLAGGSATGLIQFMPGTASDLGTTTDELARMSGVEQLDIVFAYFLPYAGQLKNLGDVYMRVLWPPAIGKSDSYVLWEVGDPRYAANQGLDLNRDGKITRAEATQKVLDRRKTFEF
jgi:hypothetical protein